MNGPSNKSETKRIYLSPPHMGELELQFIREAFETNWIAPLGPHVNAFENEFCEYLGASHAAALSSGTAALHLAMRILNIQPGDEVICSTFSFCASANAIVYEGGRPVFIDSDATSWNMDPDLLEEELRDCARRGKLPKAVVAVDLYGQSADYDRILNACRQYDLPLIEDAAEALGATYRNQKAGTFGKMGIFSFNGNKIITTSGGGMLVSEDRALVERARFLATQARDPAPHYQHSAIGYNYRMSNVLAAIGRGQLTVLPDRIAARRSNFESYAAALKNLPGLDFMPEATFGRCTRWLTCITIKAESFGVTAEQIRLALESHNIEARPVWKPLHLQPVFSGCRVRGGEMSEKVFKTGLCLPSGSNLTSQDLQRITEIISGTHNASTFNA